MKCPGSTCNIPRSMTDPCESPGAIFYPDVTVAAVVLHDGRFLMVEESVRGNIVINQPAGHLEPGESLLQAVVRECLEETAWQIEPEHFIGTYLWQAPGTDLHFLRFAFAARPIVQIEGQPLDHGIVQAIWLNRDELLAEGTRHRSPLVMQVIDDYLAGQRLPLSSVRHVV